MKKGTRTGLGVYLQTCLYRQMPFVMQANTTLNELLNIQAGVAPGSNVYPSVQCIGIGNGGLKPASNSGIWKVEAVDHMADHFGFYNQIPFILRTPDNDLTQVERANYALRRIETHGGIQYVAYYLKRLPAATQTANINLITVNNGTTTTTSFTPTSANLNPTVPNVSNTTVNSVNGSFISSSSRITCTFTPTDIAELQNVSTILYNDPAYAVISEFGIVSGVNKTVNSPSVGSTTIPFNELICAQICSFINSVLIASSATEGSSIVFDLGATEQLLALA